MATQIKREKLLDSNAPKAKKKPAPKTPPPPQQAKAQPKKAQVVAKKKSPLVKKLMKSILGLSILAIIIAPKPQLLIYKKLNLVAKSIYIPGFFGQPGSFLDSTQRVVIDKQLGLVYLCYGTGDNKEDCNRYQFIEQQGMFAAFGHYQKTYAP